jgi:tRNA-(ms[2]io[6]A)-hydroxylase
MGMQATLVDIRSFLEQFPLRSTTPDAWFEAVMEDFDLFVADHAANERKASATCMDFVVRYPDHPSLVTTASRIAHEELQHFRQVYALMKQKGIALRPDEKDVYIRHLMQHIRTDPQGRFMDRLLVASLVEMRGIERFEILSLRHPDPQWKDFYTKLHHSEKGHGHAFYHEALKIFDADEVNQRFDHLLTQEAAAHDNTPITGKFH